MTPLPDEALVVRGGQNLPANFVQGSGVNGRSGRKDSGGFSQCCPWRIGLARADGTEPAYGVWGIPHNQVGVTTVGAIRAAGGDVALAPTRTNPYHATLSGLTPEQASQLFRPTVKPPRHTHTCSGQQIAPPRCPYADFRI